jgi:hypothetical protein
MQPTAVSVLHSAGAALPRRAPNPAAVERAALAHHQNKRPHFLVSPSTMLTLYPTLYQCLEQVSAPQPWPCCTGFAHTHEVGHAGHHRNVLPGCPSLACSCDHRGVTGWCRTAAAPGAIGSVDPPRCLSMHCLLPPTTSYLFTMC